MILRRLALEENPGVLADNSPSRRIKKISDGA
jgi:hypothetical protein